MANVFFNNAKLKILNQTLDLATDTIKVMPLDATYSVNIDLDFVDEGAGASAESHEISGTGYTAGHGNSGRLTVATITLAVDDTNDRAEVTVSADSLWLALTPATDISGLLYFREGTSDDSDAVMIAFIDTVDGGSPNSFPLTLSAVDLRVVYDAEGLFQLT